MRTWRDIKKIRILTDVQGIDGWVVELEIKDNKDNKDKSSNTGLKYATFSVAASEGDFLAIVADAIKRQLETGNNAR